MRKILSIDAGGVRGMIPATVLAELETRTGQSAVSSISSLEPLAAACLSWA
jgi:patatin-like phospholipase/acyl hydrolase